MSVSFESNSFIRSGAIPQFTLSVLSFISCLGIIMLYRKKEPTTFNKLLLAMSIGDLFYALHMAISYSIAQYSNFICVIDGWGDTFILGYCISMYAMFANYVKSTI